MQDDLLTSKVLGMAFHIRDPLDLTLIQIGSQNGHCLIIDPQVFQTLLYKVIFNYQCIMLNV